MSSEKKNPFSVILCILGPWTVNWQQDFSLLCVLVLIYEFQTLTDSLI
jgi:hypothetical protein